MRDRLTELLPLLLVGVILLVFQFTRSEGLGLTFLPLAAPTAELKPPTPQPSRNQVAVAGATATAARCSSNQPRFVGSIALLRAAIGSSMGDPLECERSVDAQGNTQQRTTTGLAYRRRQLNTTVFTTGWEHWALGDDGTVVYWASDAVDPPFDAVVVTSH